MEFTKVLSARRSIRKYKPDPVPEEKLQKLYEALRLAPSGSNHQPFNFIFVKDAGLRQQLASQACHQPFVAQAPVLMVECCDAGREFDVAIAVDHMILAAANEGLGTCWMGWFERDVAERILGIADGRKAAILVPIGYADEMPDARARKPLSELVMIDRYGKRLGV
jgi:nitroreductase